MIKDRIAELLSRKLAGEATAEELVELEHWLASHPGDQYFSDILFNYWNRDQSLPASGETSSDQHFAHILEMAAEEPGKRERILSSGTTGRIARMKKMMIAASIAGLLCIPAWMIYRNVSVQASAARHPKNEVMATRGTRSKLILPDGTQVWLNADSKIQYPQSFNDTIREVTLDGEAYFDVVKNPRQPFIVHTSSIEIRVLGTAFNVKSYSQENTIETTLIHGAVAITKKGGDPLSRIMLRPKEKLIFNKQQFPESLTDKTVHMPAETDKSGIAIMALPKNVADSAISETSWVYNRLVFEGDTFSELAIKMERWYNVKITIQNERLANYRLRGVFENENVEEALKALQLIVAFTYKINNNEIEISK